MKTRIVLGIIAAAGFIVWGCPAATPAEQTGGAQQKPAKQTSKSDDAKVSWGKYLVDFGGCHDCHSPKIMTDRGPVPDPKLMLSGHPQSENIQPFDVALVTQDKWVLFTHQFTGTVGEWGITRAFNLTPDDNTGTGLWEEKHFLDAMRTGKHMGSGRPIAPPMPWMNLAGLEDKDLAAIFSYLQSIPPIANNVPAPITLDEAQGIAKKTSTKP